MTHAARDKRAQQCEAAVRVRLRLLRRRTATTSTAGDRGRALHGRELPLRALEENNPDLAE